MVEAVFWLSLALLAYTFFGYPLLMAAWAKLRPWPVRRAPHLPHVAVVVVAYNEAGRIADKIETCLAQDYPSERMRVLVVSDGSTDATCDIVRSYADRRVDLLAIDQRRGKAGCLNDAAAACQEEIIVFTDARQRLNPQAVRCAVSGELVFVDDQMSGYAQGVDAYWQYEKFIRQCEARVHSVPGVTGALYALRRECFLPIPARTVLDDVLIPMRAALAGWRVVFDGRAHAYDKPSQSAAQEKTRKVRTLAGNYQLIALEPRLLLPIINPLFVQFVSHKMLRLVAPFALLALALASLGAAPKHWFYACAALVQAVGYAAVVAGDHVPSIGRRKLVRLGRSFIVLNWYAVLGLAHFLSNKNAHLWHTRATPVAGQQPK
jgi:poly-beta-1,6-N-acetyl-D-glucosamine synthase